MKKLAMGRVLVVDDDVAVRVSLEAALADDFDVVSAPDAAAAEHVLSREQVDVLLTDYEMPGMTGVELLKRTRTLHPHVVGVLLTGHGTHREVRRADLDQEIFGVVLKPYEPRELISRVRRAVSIAQLRRTTGRMKVGVKQA